MTELPHRFRAVLARTTTDQIKSKILSPELTQIVLDCYMTPEKFAHLLSKYFDKDFIVEVNDGE